MWPFRRKQTRGDALTEWLKSYDTWLKEFQQLCADFPDHTSLEGSVEDEAVRHILHRITELYVEDTCEIIEKHVLQAEMLRRRLKARST